MAGKFEIKKSKGKFHFNLKSGNNQVILSSQMYATKKAAENGINAVRKNCKDEKRIDRREAKNKKPYFVIKSGNGQEVGRSQMYSSRSAMENGIKSVQTNAPKAAIVDATAA